MCDFSSDDDVQQSSRRRVLSPWEAIKRIVQRHKGRISVKLCQQLIHNGHYEKEKAILVRHGMLDKWCDKWNLHTEVDEMAKYGVQVDSRFQWLSVDKKPGPLSDSDDDAKFEIELPKRMDLDYLEDVTAMIRKANTVLTTELETGFIDTSLKGTVGDGLPWWGDFDRRLGGRRFCATAEQIRRAQKQRKRLPAYQMQNDVNDTILQRQTVVIVGATGCGKSSQIPICFYNCAKQTQERVKILVCQPRKIAALSLAERVAMERGEEVGQTVGYKIRYDTKASDRTDVLYCTTGSILRAMMRNPTLEGVTAIFLDEIHERDCLGDFTMMVLRDLQAGARPDLKVILMSATVDPTWCLSYFEDCVTLNLPGDSPFEVAWAWLEDCLLMTRHEPKPTYAKEPPISAHDIWEELPTHHRDRAEDLVAVMSAFDDWIDYDLIEKLVVYINEQEDLSQMNAVHDEDFVAKGAILIFLPGWGEIRQLINRLTRHHNLQHSCYVLALHSNVPKKDQDKVFQRPTDPRMRKIVVSTNIAESSLTIDDVVYVIDSGRERMTAVNENTNVSSLTTKWIARSNANQRRGRAGRCRKGQYFCLFSQWQYDNAFLNEHLPEMQRMPVESICLQVKALEIVDPLEEVLPRVPSPPSPVVIQHAINALATLGAITYDGDLTRLGKKLCELPLHPSLGKMVLLARLFQVSDSVLTIAAVLDNKSPFYDRDPRAMEEKVQLSGGLRSDHWTFVQAHRRFKNGTASRGSLLNMRALENVERQRGDLLRNLQEMMHQGKNVERPTENFEGTVQEEWAVVSAILASSLNMARLTPQFDMVCLASPPCWAVTGMSSVNDRRRLMDPRLFERTIALWYTRLETKQLFLNECSLVPGFGALLFGPPLRQGDLVGSNMAQLMPPKTNQGDFYDDEVYQTKAQRYTEKVRLIKEATEALYQEHNPGRVAHIDSLFTKYQGVEREMYCRICKKYGLEVPEQFALSDSEDDEDRGEKRIRNGVRHSPWLAAEDAQTMKILLDLRENLGELLDMSVGRPLHLHAHDVQQALLHVRDMLLHYNRMDDLSEPTTATQFTVFEEPWTDDYQKHKRACSHEEFQLWKANPRQQLKTWIHRELKRIGKKVSIRKMNQALEWEVGTDFSVEQCLSITKDFVLTHSDGLFGWEETEGRTMIRLTPAGRQNVVPSTQQNAWNNFRATKLQNTMWRTHNTKGGVRGTNNAQNSGNSGATSWKTTKGGSWGKGQPNTTAATKKDGKGQAVVKTNWGHNAGGGADKTFRPREGAHSAEDQPSVKRVKLTRNAASQHAQANITVPARPPPSSSRPPTTQFVTTRIPATSVPPTTAQHHQHRSTSAPAQPKSQRPTPTFRMSSASQHAAAPAVTPRLDVTTTARATAPAAAPKARLRPTLVSNLHRGAVIPVIKTAPLPQKVHPSMQPLQRGGPMAASKAGMPPRAKPKVRSAVTDTRHVANSAWDDIF